MEQPSVHPELQRANEFAAAHADFLSHVFAEFVSKRGEWPQIERLQLVFERREIDVDVGRLAWEMPKSIGFPEGERVVLRVRALVHVPEAKALLADWHAVLALAYRRWREREGEEEAVIRWADLITDLGLEEDRAWLIVTLLSRESWAFGSGGDGEGWWREVRSGVRVARNTSNAQELIAARDAVEYPPISAQLNAEIDEAPRTAQERVARARRLRASSPELSVMESADTPPKADPDRERRVMVVVGRDHLANEAVFDFLRAIDLKPMEWPQLVAETQHATPYIGQVLDSAMEVVQAVVVLFTPDDLVRLRPSLLRSGDDDGERRLTGQPRPNVLFEAGLAFGRHPTRTVLVEHGELRGLSDLFGRHVVRLQRGTAALHELAQRLKAAGCRVDTRGESWLDVSRFPEPADVELEARSTATVRSNGPSEEADGLEPLERLLREILVAAGNATPDDVVGEIARRIAHLEGPTRGEFLEGLPGRMIPPATIKRLLFELAAHGVLRRNEGAERGYVLGSLPGRPSPGG